MGTASKELWNREMSKKISTAPFILAARFSSALSQGASVIFAPAYIKTPPWKQGGTRRSNATPASHGLGG